MYDENARMYDGMPTEWRELIQLSPQKNEKKEVDSAVQVRKASFLGIKSQQE